MAWLVSTHSRLKAAGFLLAFSFQFLTGFNTQPPEGGWANAGINTDNGGVSTHSRLKAAGLPDDH